MAYIGSSINVFTRWQTHRSELSKGNHRNFGLQEDWNALGEDAFAFNVLALAPPERLSSLEENWITSSGQFVYNMRTSTSREADRPKLPAIFGPLDTTPKYTTTKAAQILGITAGRARVIRAKMGLGDQLGRDWLLSDADIERMRQRDTKPGPKPKPTPPTTGQ